VSRVYEHASANDARSLAQYLAGIMARMKDAGASVGVIPALTPHLCIDELVQVSPIPVVSILDAVDREIAARGLKRIALFGTRFVVESNMFGKLHGVTFAALRPEEVTFVHDTYSQLARTGAATAGQREQLIALAQTLQHREAVEAIVLAGTDLALIFDETNTPFPHLDCARAHIQAIMRSLNDR
jgi:aspartate racemase